MKNDTYDALKMIMDDSETSLKQETEYLKNVQNNNENCNEILSKADLSLNDAQALLSELGIDLSKEISKAKKEIKIDVDDLHYSDLLKVEEIEYRTYDELVRIAHERGYENTKIQDLLSDEEIVVADSRFKKIENEFRLKTKLDGKDLTFLFIAVALQVLRQYVVDPFLKEHRKKAGQNDEKGRKEAKKPGWYRVATEDILTNTVPFDVHYYGDKMSDSGFLKDFKNHRDVTLGHDPFLGWVFGTANIMTGTVTNVRFDSAHVKYVIGKGNVIHSNADTKKVFETVVDRVSSEGIDGLLALVYAVIREGIHLKSDLYTAHSLSLPGLSTICPDFAKKLLDYGIDTASVGTEMALSTLINLIISLVHRLMKEESENEQFYEVKTRKILLYSNLIATSSNLIAVGIAAGVGVAGENPDAVKKAINYLDVGGLIVTITRLFSDVRFITKVKEEFIDSKIDEQNKKLIEMLDADLARFE